MDEGDGESIEVDQILVNIKECFVYQIPALRTSQGHRAEDWKLESPLFTGGLRVYQRNESLRIIVYRQLPLSMQPTDDSPYSIFAESKITLSTNEGDILRYVDGVIDSSRYFVLKIKDQNSERSTYIGIGFRERDCAFEFKNSINDYIRYLDRRIKANVLHKAALETVSNISEPDELNQRAAVFNTKLALKDGEKLVLRLGGVEREKKGGSISKAHSAAEIGGSLKPLPKPQEYNKLHISSILHTSKENSAKKDAIEEEDWGDFVSS